jgi:hypothetical protein
MLTKLLKTFKPKISFRTFISGNRQNRENRDKKEIAKFELFWKGIDKMVLERRELEKKIENKYDGEDTLLGNDKHTSENITQLYYIPLTKEDEGLLVNFSNKAIDSIRKGGRLVLKEEVELYNSENLVNKIPFDFIPLNENEVEDLKKSFPEIYEDSKLFYYALQQGKPFYNTLIKYKDESTNMSKSYLSYLKYIVHYSHFGNKPNPPFNTKISMEFPKHADPHYIKLVTNKLNEDNLCKTFKKIYLDYYEALIQAFKEKNPTPSLFNSKLNNLNDRVDTTMLERTKVFLDCLHMNNLNVSFDKDDVNIDTAYIIDKLLVKGVYQDRSKNFEAYEYICVNTHEDMGIRYFIQKSLVNYNSDAAILSMLSNNAKPSDDHSEADKSFVLRITLIIKIPYKLNIGHNLLEYPSDYNYTHLAVFENQLIPPHHTFLIKHDFEQWLSNHKIDPSGWKLVDVDNFMKGNSFFKETSLFEDALVEELQSKERLLNFLETKYTDIKAKPEKDIKATSDKAKKQQKKDEKDLVGTYRVKKIKEYQPDELTKILNNTDVKKNIEKEAKVDEPKLKKSYESIESIITNNVIKA